MAEVLISSVLDLLLSITREQAARELKLVTGVDKEMKKLESNFRAIRAVIEDADTRQLREGAVKKWLLDLKDVSYDIDDVLDEWKTNILKHEMEPEAEASVKDSSHLQKKVWCAFSNLCSCFHFPQQVVLRHEIAIKIEELNGKLDDIARQRDMYNFEQNKNKGGHEQGRVTASVIDESEVLAREEDERKIKDLLLCESSQETTSNLRIISIVGMGGIGKTTLTRLAYNSKEVKDQFGAKIWVCVSEPFDEERIAKEILESLVNEKPNLGGRDIILQHISRHVSGKKILLVLDDVWTEDPANWEQLKASLKTCSPGSRILVTTRNQTAADRIGCGEDDTLFLGKLSEEKCWSLFCHLAFSRKTTEYRTSLEDIGRKIVGRCDGLPLAVKVVAGLLHSKNTREKWQHILYSDMWEVEGVEERVFGPLLLSFYDLPPVLRQCFSYCAIFPKDYQIEKKKLVELWMAQGFLKETPCKTMKIIGEEYFDKLAMLSFFQDFEKDESNAIESCKMHDIVHDFAQFLTAKECLFMEMDHVEESRENTSFGNIRHLMIIARNERVGIPRENWKKIRTLLIMDRAKDLGNLLNSIDHLTCLRALGLSGSRCKMLSNEIGKLTHLRYLNLSGNENLESLPEEVCGLYNLQSLDISWCYRIRELPRAMEKLINLVHLHNEYIYSLRFMPKGMERLTRLQTLKEFVVSSGGGSLDGLGKLIHLQGHLTITIRRKEGKKAQLSAMKEVRHLTLKFILFKVEYESVILETLQPPPCLESFELTNFEGPPLLPDWMMSLTTLKIVRLNWCQNWETLPPLGKLPSLEQLHMGSMFRVKKVGRELLGMETSSSSSSSSSYTAFPKLNRIEFDSLDSWEEWEYGEAASSCCVTIMPCLKKLVIENCPKLKMLPHHILHNPKIQLLERTGFPIPKERFISPSDP